MEWREGRRSRDRVEIGKREIEILWESRRFKWEGDLGRNEECRNVILFSYTLEVNEVRCIEVSLFYPPKADQWHPKRRYRVDTLEKCCNESLVGYINYPCSYFDYKPKRTKIAIVGVDILVRTASGSSSSGGNLYLTKGRSSSDKISSGLPPVNGLAECIICAV